MRRTRGRWPVLGVAALSVVALGCAGDDDGSETTTTPPAEEEFIEGDDTTSVVGDGEVPQEMTPEEREEAGDIYELDEASFVAAVAAETDCETLRRSFIVSGLGVEQGDIDADKDTVADRAFVIAQRQQELDCHDDQ